MIDGHFGVFFVCTCISVNKGKHGLSAVGALASIFGGILRSKSEIHVKREKLAFYVIFTPNCRYIWSNF